MHHQYLFFKRSLKLFLKVVAGLLLSIVLLIAYGYWYGLLSLPNNNSPSTKVYSSLALDTTWVSIGGSGARVMTPLTLWNWVKAFSLPSRWSQCLIVLDLAIL
jgi:hypothetical protein